MRKLFITLLAVGLLSIMGGQAQNRSSRHQLDLTPEYPVIFRVENPGFLLLLFPS